MPLGSSHAPRVQAAMRGGPSTPKRRSALVCAGQARPEEAGRRPSRPLVHASSRRSLLLGSCGCVCCGACSSAARNPVLDRLFASAMSDGMREYEAAVAPLKLRLFAQLLSPPGRAPAAAGALQVLELGIGTGPNLQFYGRGDGSSSGSGSGSGGATSVELTGVDPNAFMLPYLRENAAAAGYAPDAVRWIEGTAEALPLDDASFDAVVCTLVLCSVADVDAVLAEAKRVLRPGGRFLFIEHTLAPKAQPLRRLQQRLLNPLQRLLADGCHLNRDPLPAIQGVFSGVDATRLEVEGMGLIGSHVAGIASL